MIHVIIKLLMPTDLFSKKARINSKQEIDLFLYNK